MHRLALTDRRSVLAEDLKTVVDQSQDHDRQLALAGPTPQCTMQVRAHGPPGPPHQHEPPSTTNRTIFTVTTNATATTNPHFDPPETRHPSTTSTPPAPTTTTATTSNPPATVAHRFRPSRSQANISKKRKFVADGVFYAELNELLTRELAEEGYAGVEVRVTPMRTEIIIRATRTQNVLGEKGRRIRELTSVVQKR